MTPSRVKTETSKSDISHAIRRYRESLKLTVAELAKDIGVSRNTLTNYEAGKTEPTASDLLRLTSVLGCSIAELLGVSEDDPQPRFAFRAHASLRSDPSVTLLAQRYLRAYAEIEEITQTKLCDRLGHFVCRSTEPLTDRQIEAFADGLRQSCGMSERGPENIAAVLESLGVRCLFFSFDGHGLDGISAIQGDMILTMLKHGTKNVERIIFSAAHELGHLVLHPFLFTETAVDAEDSKRYEKEANIFAGAFLVPSNELARIWRDDGLYKLPLFHALLILKRMFHVSYWSLFYRVKALQLTDMEWPAFTYHTKQYMGISGKAKVEDLEPDPIDSKMLFRTTRFDLLVRSAFVQQLIGISKVADLLQLSVEAATELTAKWLTPNTEPIEE